MGVQSIPTVIQGLYKDFGVFYLMETPINLSPIEIRLSTRTGNKLWLSMGAKEVTCQTAPFIMGTKCFCSFLLTSSNLPPEHAQ